MGAWSPRGAANTSRLILLSLLLRLPLGFAPVTVRLCQFAIPVGRMFALFLRSIHMAALHCSAPHPVEHSPCCIIQEPGVNRVPEQQHSSDHVTEERRLEAVACRVEPMVTHPAPPQTRTCAINACGSSGRASATHIHCPVGCGDTIGERKVSLVYRTRWNALPDVAFPPGGRLGLTSPRSTVVCGAPTATWPSRGSSLVARSPIPCVLPSFVVSPQGSWPGRSAQPTPGLLVTRSPIPGLSQGARWLSQVPEFPLCRHAPLSDPGGVLHTR